MRRSNRRDREGERGAQRERAGSIKIEKEEEKRGCDKRRQRAEVKVDGQKQRGSRRRAEEQKTGVFFFCYFVL
ncbi:hypothetical protein C1H46_027940 [Malus baccata]|uniref:Uncharacterized protein n=1 Tax=Malus baccata TaxID=106549 RepID=A0A540LJ07_MALBA|nr:hypothetical protein C1H46_027940 [Malus baccata]